VRGGLESAFGRSFSDVRVHTDPEAAGVSDNLNARAFTIGQNIAFGTGEYRPGTLIGDALIAHELAHVAQQDGAAPGEVQTKADGETSLLEEDADSAAVRAVVAMRAGLFGGLARISQEAMPRLRAGLRLQRCGKSKEAMDEAGANIEKFAALIGLPDENADELEQLLDEGNPSDMAYALSTKKTLNDERHLRALGGTAGGRRVLAAMRKVLDRGDGYARDMSGLITTILNDYEAEQASPKTPVKEEHQGDLDRLNTALTGGGEYGATEVDYPPGQRTPIVPLQFPVVLKPDVPQMGGLYYNPYFSTKETTHGAKAVGEGWNDGDIVQTPLIYIEIGPRALFHSIGGEIDRSKPSSDANIKSVLFHEFHHYKQLFARRGGPVSSEDPRAVDRESDAEVEATGYQIALDAVNPDITDRELRGNLEYMGKNLRDARESFRNEAFDRIVTAVTGNPEAQKKLIRLIDELIANEDTKVKKETENKVTGDEKTIPMMRYLEPLKARLVALTPQLPKKQPKPRKPRGKR
jgi:hypothetical protein